MGALPVQGARVFFPAAAKLPEETPPGIKALRQRELLSLQVKSFPITS
jgi:hypothetical protein